MTHLLTGLPHRPLLPPADLRSIAVRETWTRYGKRCNHVIEYESGGQWVKLVNEWLPFDSRPFVLMEVHGITI